MYGHQLSVVGLYVCLWDIVAQASCVLGLFPSHPNPLKQISKYANTYHTGTHISELRPQKHPTTDMGVSMDELHIKYSSQGINKH